MRRRADTWRPNPHFYGVNTGSYDYYEQAFMPSQTALELHYDRPQRFE